MVGKLLVEIMVRKSAGDGPGATGSLSPSPSPGLCEKWSLILCQ